MRKLSAAQVIRPLHGAFSADEVSRILSPDFLGSWIEYCETQHGIDSNRLRMTSPYHVGLLSRDLPDELTLLEKFYWHRHSLTAYPKSCLECSQPVKLFHGFSKGYSGEFCSRKCALGSAEVKARKAVTTKKKYGVENVSQLDIVKQKVRTTVIRKYGAFYNPQVRDQTNLTLYGTKNPTWLSGPREKRNKTRVSRLFSKLVYPQEFVPQFSEEDYLADGEGKYPVLHTQCGKVFKQQVPFDKIRCLSCEGGRSSLERSVAAGIKHREVHLGSMIDLDGRRVYPDIRVENLLIEIDGNYWHSELRGGDKHKTYHRVKQLRQAGYQVMVFFEDEVVEKLSIVHSMINAKLGIFDAVIPARKCVLAPITASEAQTFMDQHHIQGHANSSTRVGLRYDGKIIGAATAAKKRFAKGEGHELIRLAFAKNTAVPGGAERLICALKKEAPDLISYSDNRFGEGAVYSRMGKLISENRPSYFYLRKGDYLKRLSRLKFQKHKLQTQLESFDPMKSEWENMQENGYDRIWDCGSRTWEITLKL